MIISRYLIKEVLSAFLAVTFILLLVFICNQFVRYLSYAASGKVGANILLQLLGLEIPNLLALLCPLGIYLGIIFTYGRLYADNEIRVMQACGFSTRQLLIITSQVALFTAIMISFLTLWVNPQVALEKDKLITQSIAAENIMNTLMPGRFQVINTADAQRVVYVENVTRNHKEARNIFYAEQKMKKNPDEIGDRWSVLSAARGYQTREHATQDRFVVAQNGFRYEGAPGQNNYKIIEFSKYAVRIPDHVSGLPHQLQEVTPTSVLLQHHTLQNAAELQWRLSIPLSALLLGILAIPLSQTRPRQGRYAHLLPAILIYVVYINLLFVGRDWMMQNKMMAPILGLWWVHGILILIIAFAFLWKSRKFSFTRASL